MEEAPLPSGKGVFFVSALRLANVKRRHIMPNPKIKLTYDQTSNMFSFTKFPERKKVRLGLATSEFKTIDKARSAAKEHGLRLSKTNVLVS